MLPEFDCHGLPDPHAADFDARHDGLVGAMSGTAHQPAGMDGMSAAAVDAWAPLAPLMFPESNSANHRRPPGPGRSSSRLSTLTDINLDDLFDAAGLLCLRHTPLQRLFSPSARRFAVTAQAFDNLVGQQGLAQGSSWLLHRMTGGAQVSGAGRVPAAGPVVVLANHPGMTDTVALLASLASRTDLRVIALDRPFLRALPNVARQLIVVPDHEGGRMGVLRLGAKHLKQGGALLTFPAGQIEPDPATFGRRRAVESVHRWSDSYLLFAKLVPQTRFVPAIVSNVVSPEAQQHVLTLLRRTYQGKERLAAALQVAMPRYQKRVARVAFGPSLQLRASGADALRSAILAQIRHLIETSGDGQEGALHGRASRRGRLQHGEWPVI